MKNELPRFCGPSRTGADQQTSSYHRDSWGGTLLADHDSRHCQIEDFRGKDQLCRLLTALAVKGGGLTQGHDVFYFGRVDYVFEDAVAKCGLVETLQNEAPTLRLAEIE